MTKRASGKDIEELAWLSKIVATTPDPERREQARLRLEKLKNPLKDDPLPDPPVVRYDEVSERRWTTQGSTLLAQDPKGRDGRARRLLRTAAGGYVLLLNDRTLKPLEDRGPPPDRLLGAPGHPSHLPENDHSGTSEQEAVRIWQRMEEKVVPTLEAAFPDFAARLEDA